MYKRISIQNFRSLKKVNFEKLGRINLLVGENNSGKTSVLEALFLLTGPTNPNLPVKINMFRGLNVINEEIWKLFFYNLNPDEKILITGESDVPRETRKLSISPIRRSPHTDLDPVIGLNKDVSGSAASVSKLNGLNLELSLNGSSKKKLLTSIRLVQEKLEVTGNESQLGMIDGVFLSPSTIYLDMPRFLEQQKIKKRTGEIIRSLQSFQPKIKGIDLGLEKNIYCDVGLSEMIPIHVLGDGLKRALAISLAMAATENGILLIDEIENGLFPNSLRVLWEVILEASRVYNVQMFISTHSIDCLQAVTNLIKKIKDGEELMIHRMEGKENSHRIVSMTIEELAEALENGWEIR